MSTDRLSFRQRSRFLTTLLLVSAVLAACLSYLHLAQAPPSALAFSPAFDPDAWSFVLADGTQVEPDGDGTFSLPRPDSTLYCSRVLPEDAGPNVLLSFSCHGLDTAVLLDGQLLAAPSMRYQTGTGFPPAGDEVSVPDGGLISLGDAGGRTLTLAVQFLQASPALDALPTLSLYAEPMAYLYQGVAAGAAAALPAGIYLTVTLCLLALFLLQLWKDTLDGTLLLLAVCTLLTCLRQASSYSLSALPFLRTPALLRLAQIAPILSLLWLLWYRASGRVRALGWLLPAGVSAGTLVLAALYQLQLSGAQPMDLLQGKLLPLALLVCLLEALWEALRGSRWHRRLLGLFGCLLALWTGCAVLRLLWRGSAPQFLLDLRASLSWGSLFPVADLLGMLLLPGCVLLTLAGFIRAAARRDAAFRTLCLQKQHAEENAASLYRSLEDTLHTRHEMRHHMEAVRALCQAGDLERVREYADQMCRSSLSAAAYTKNPLANALLAPRLDYARSAGVRTHILVQLPEDLPMDDVDLSMFLTNLLDNAVSAASAASGDRKYLTLRINVQGSRLSVLCENGYDGSLSLPSPSPGRGKVTAMVSRLCGGWRRNTAVPCL